MSKEKRHPLVLVEWEDSIQPLSAWQWLNEPPELKVTKCSTVGWLVAEDKTTLMLAQNVAGLRDGESQGSGFMRIPQSCITRRIKLKANA